MNKIKIHYNQHKSKLIDIPEGWQRIWGEVIKGDKIAMLSPIKGAPIWRRIIHTEYGMSTYEFDNPKRHQYRAVIRKVPSQFKANFYNIVKFSKQS